MHLKDFPKRPLIFVRWFTTVFQKLPPSHYLEHPYMFIIDHAALGGTKFDENSQTDTVLLHTVPEENALY